MKLAFLFVMATVLFATVILVRVTSVGLEELKAFVDRRNKAGNKHW